MSKPIPVFAFAFIAFELTSRGRLELSPQPSRSKKDGARVGRPKAAENSEGHRFKAAWRFEVDRRRGFSVCVRVEKLPKSPGFRLLTPGNSRLLKAEYLWLNEIDETAEGFFGRAHKPLDSLAGVFSNQRISFALPNVLHWAFSLAEETRDDDLKRSLNVLATPAREPAHP